jgi:hypothetical protein
MAASFSSTKTGGKGDAERTWYSKRTTKYSGYVNHGQHASATTTFSSHLF